MAKNWSDELQEMKINIRSSLKRVNGLLTRPNLTPQSFVRLKNIRDAYTSLDSDLDKKLKKIR